MTLSWIIFITLFCFLVYTLLFIKNEKKLALKNAQDFNFGPFSFKIPPWWSVDSSRSRHEKEITFHRADTTYDWFATFQYHQSQLTPSAFLIDYCQSKKIILDSEIGDVSVKNLTYKKDKMEMIRIESTATMDETDRLYLCVIVIKLHNPNYTDGLFIFINQSSVLSGLVEGPYFESIYESLIENVRHPFADAK